MVYKKGATTTAAVPASETGAGTKATADAKVSSADNAGLITTLIGTNDKIGTVKYHKNDTETSLKGFTLTSEQVANVTSLTTTTTTNGVTTTTPASGVNATGVNASFTFWDSTDEGASQSCVLHISDLTLDLVDTVNPKVVVNPFYWDSASSNSLYNNSKDNGHIELEGDLPTATFTGTSGEFDLDPKVSGKITFTGTAYDDHTLKNLKFTLSRPVTENGTTTDTAYAGFNAVPMATYDAASTDTTYVNNGGWSALSGSATDGKYEWTISRASTDTARRYGDTCYLSQEGHKIYWTITIDTEQISDVAATDVKLTVTATDKSDLSSADATTTSDSPATDKTDAKENHVPVYKMDVVPYITEIKTDERKASGLKDNNIRSASGKYSILANNADNVITVNGFNFIEDNNKLAAKIAVTSPNTANAVPYGTTLASGTTTGDTAATANAAATSVRVIGITKGSNTRSVTLTNSSVQKSGYLEIFSNGVRTLNNLNNNNAHGSFAFTGKVVSENTTPSVNDYKNMPNRVNEADFYTTKNVTLTDDRYLRFFDMKDTGKKNGYYPNMIMDGNDPVFGFVDLNGTTDANYGNDNIKRMKAGYQPQRAKFSGTNGTQSSIEYLIGGMTWDQMAMAKDSAGKYFHATVYNYSESNMEFIYNTFASNHTWQVSGRGTAYKGAWGLGGTYAAMSTTNYYGTTTWYITKAENTKNNAIALESIEYGDNGALVGRYQNLKLFVKGSSTTTAGAKVYMAYYDDNTTNKDVIFRTFRVAKSATGNNNQLYDTGIYSNLTEKNTSGRIAVRPTNNTTIRGSKYLDIGVTSDDHVIVIFYDTQEGKLKMFYSGNKIDGSSITPTPNWTAASVSFPSYVGTDVSMVIDGSNGIHITASDSTDSDLIYMYMPSYNSSTLKVIRVDQAFSVGTWTQIKVKGNATDGYVPYIAYYNATETGSRDSIKLAYFTDTENKISTTTQNQDNLQDVDSSGYTTGKWEYMTVPAIDPPQGGDSKFRNVCLDFDSAGKPVVGYLGTNIEFGKWLDE